jgi:hypothetical protein
VKADIPNWYRMVRDDSARGRTHRTRIDGTWESDWIGHPSQARRFGQRLTPDACLRLDVVLPDGYPVGDARCRVRLMSDPGRIDSAEQSRLTQLGADEGRQDGLRQSGATLSLSVTRPQLDRMYQIEWRLPDRAKLNRWCDAQRKLLESRVRQRL